MKNISKKISLITTLGFILASCTTTTTVDGKPVPDKPKKVGVTQATKLKELPDVAQLNYSMGLSYIQSGNMDAAAQKLEEVTKIAPKFPGAYNALGVLEEERGRKDQAKIYYTKALSLNANYEEASSNYARLQCSTGSSIDALAANAQASTKAGLYAGAAQCALDANNISSAESYIQMATAADANYPLTYFVKAKIDARAHNNSAAFTSLDRYHNLQGYTRSSIQFGLELATQAGDSARMEKYKQIQSTQFK